MQRPNVVAGGGEIVTMWKGGARIGTEKAN